MTARVSASLIPVFGPHHMQFGRPILFPLVLFLLATGVVLVAYLRLPRRLSRGSRTALIVLRILAIALLLFGFMEPTRVLTREEPIRAQVAILLDRSQSMTIQDEQGPEGLLTRWDAASATASELIRTLSDRFDVREYTFDSQLRPFRAGDSAKPEGRSTDVLEAVQEAISEARGTPMAGIVLLTDGAQNVGTLEAPTSYAAPVFALGVGDPEPPKDIAVTQLSMDPVLFVDEQATVRASVRARGYPNRSLTVAFLENDRPIAVESVETTGVASSHDVEFTFTPRAEGTFRYSVRVSPLLNELTDANNVRSFTAQVLPSRTRVLLIDGTPRYEFAFLRRTLERIPTIELTAVLRAAPSRPPESIPAQRGVYPLGRGGGRMPTNPSDLLAYDVIIVGDVPVMFLTAAQRDGIAQFVERHGRGIAWLAGEQWLSKRLGVGQIERLLPVRVPAAGARVAPEEFAPALSPEGRFHPVTQLAESPEANDLVWRQMPLWTRLYRGITPKPGSTVLVWANDTREPVVLYERVGSGKSLLIATDSLWRWGFGAKLSQTNPTQSNAYDRFWAQAVRWLATPIAAKQVTISLAQPELVTGDLAEIAVRVFDTGFLPVSDAIVQLMATDPQGDTVAVPVAASRTTPGHYQARLRLTQIGTYRLNADARARGVLLGRDSVTFEVVAPRLEFERIERNDRLLTTVADASGGKFVPIRDSATILPLLQESRQSRTVRERRALWDHPIMLFGALALLGAEWILRKRKGLV